jgi:transcription antitermination factor NusG
MSLFGDEVNWYAVRTRSNFETRVATQLAAKGFEHYLPAYEETRQWKDRRQKISVPLFSGYVFARFHDSAEERVRVLATTGVAGVLGCGGRPEAVRVEELAAVRGLLDSRAACILYPYLKKGDWVRVRRGPLQGLEGYLVRFKGDARLVISVSALAQSVAAELDARDVEPAKKLAAA